MEKECKKAYAAELLSKRRDELGRLPLRKDFDAETACFIKQVLGPWPRALEAAGLKEAARVSRKEKNRLKHEALRKRRKLEKRAKRLGETPGEAFPAGADEGRRMKETVFPRDSRGNGSG